jgi:hypothetical protein
LLPVRTNVRYAPNSDQILRGSEMTLSAKSGLMHRSKERAHSISSSARESNDGGTSRPSGQNP